MYSASTLLDDSYRGLSALQGSAYDLHRTMNFSTERGIDRYEGIATEEGPKGNGKFSDVAAAPRPAARHR